MSKEAIAGKPKELRTPRTEVGGDNTSTGLTRRGELSTESSEGFANIPFYRALLNYQIVKYAPFVHTVLDEGSGTGPAIEILEASGKLLTPPLIKAIDINEVDLAKGSEKFRRRGSNVQFIKASAVNLPFRDSIFQLITAFNFWHLLRDDQAAAFDETFRVGEDGATFLWSCAYVKGLGVPDRAAAAEWLGIFKNSRQVAEQKYGITNIPMPPDLMKYTLGEYKGQAEAAGFVNVVTEEHIAEIPREQSKSLVTVAEFALGALPIPGDPKITLPIAQDCLVQAVDLTLERTGREFIRRGWGLLKGTVKKAA